MCLAIPGRLVEIHENNGMRMGKAEFGGIVKSICLDYIPDARIDDYVLVHVGFALSRVDAEEAARTYAILEQLNQLGELEQTDPSEPLP